MIESLSLTGDICREHSFDRLRTPQSGGTDREHALNTYTLAVEGLIDSTAHATLEGAVAALRTLVTELPINPAEAEALDLFLSEPDRAADYVRRDGSLRLEFAAAGAVFTAVISPNPGPGQS